MDSMTDYQFPIYNPNKPYHLIKFGSKRDMEDLFENGTIYSKPFNYYKNLEDGKVRGDKDEGVSYLQNWSNTKLEIFNETTRKPIGAFENQPLQLKEYVNEYKSGNLNPYCLYSTTNPDSFQLFDIRMLEFGDHCVFFHNSQAFHDRIRAKLKVLQLKVGFGHICYYDQKTYGGQLSLFNKRDEYQWQSEYRFLIINPVIDILKFSIGSVKDIAEINQLPLIGIPV